MKRTILLLVLLAGAEASHAHAIAALVQTCSRGVETWVCPVAYTRLNVFEAVLFHEVAVRATFRGPDYDVSATDTETVLFLFPSTWRAQVTIAACAFSGVHSAEGQHWVVRDDPDLPPLA